LRIYRIRKFPTRLVIAAIFLAIIILEPKLILRSRDLLFSALSRPLSVFSGVKRHVNSLKYLKDDNLRLKQEVASLSVTVARLNALEVENERLRSLLKFKDSFEYKVIIANAVAGDPVDWRKGIIINKGRADGVRERMPCTTAHGVIGSVLEAGKESSKVMLLSDPNSRLGVVLESSGESGLLVGAPEGSPKVIYLPLDADIEKGERVVTGGFSEFSPSGLLIGSVSRVDVDRANLYKFALVDLSQDVRRIEEVICIDKVR
jgi:rod shape-determining protein MreC